MVGADCLLDGLDKLLAILLGGHMVLFVLPKCMAPAKSAGEPRKKIRFAFSHMPDKRLQYAFVSEYPAFKIGVLDCHVRGSFSYLMIAPTRLPPFG